VSYVFFPGCSLDGTAKDFHRSTLAVAAKLVGDARVEGLDLLRLDGGALDRSAAGRCAAAKSLANAGGATVAVACAACYSRLKAANHHIAGDAAVRARVARWWRGLRRPHAGAPSARDPVPRDRVAADRPNDSAAAGGAEGGLLLRLPAHPSTRDHQFRRRREPTLMDRLMETAGATALEWPHKTECCGRATPLPTPASCWS